MNKNILIYVVKQVKLLKKIITIYGRSQHYFISKCNKI